MSKITVNFGELIQQSGSALEPLPIGQYDVEVEKAEPKTASTGKLMFVVTFKVTSGPHSNRRIFNNFVINAENPNALSFFFAHMAALGLTKDFFTGNPTPDQVSQQLVGKRARVDLGQRPYNGQTRNEVKKVLPPQGGGVPPAVPPPAQLAPPLPPPAPPSPPPAPAPAPKAEELAPEAPKTTPAPPPVPF